MRKHRDEYSIARMASVLGVSESGYYRWLSRKPSKRAEEDLVLIEEIAEIFYASRRVFGSRKITSIMRSRGRLINHKRVARLMSEYCLHSRVCKEYNSFTEPGDGNNIKENLLKREFSIFAAGSLSGWLPDQETTPNLYPQRSETCADAATEATAAYCTLIEARPIHRANTRSS